MEYKGYEKIYRSKGKKMRVDVVVWEEGGLHVAVQHGSEKTGQWGGVSFALKNKGEIKTLIRLLKKAMYTPQ
jgi:hypothetical protein